MRVLHLTRDFPPGSAGGISTAVGWLVDQLDGEGVEQAIASFDGWRPRKQALRVERAGRVLHVQGRAWDAVRGFAEEFGPDVTAVHDPMLWCEVPGERVLVLHVDHERLGQVRGLERPTQALQAQLRVLAEGGRVIAPSEAVAARLRGRGVHGVRVAGLGLDPGSPRAGGGDRVVYLGRFDEAKGTGILLRAMEGIGAPILAGGLPHNPRAEARWRDRWPRAEWRGWLDAPGRAALFDEAALVAVPSLEETFGLVALEAMAAGVPVLASDVGGLGELVRSVGGGEVLPAGDVDAWRSGIQRMLVDAGLRGRLGRRGAEAVADRWTWPALRGAWTRALYG